MHNLIKVIGATALGSLLVCCTGSDSDNPSQSLAPPVALKQDSVLTVHGDSRVDPYFWMRLTDEQKIATEPDAQTQQVIQYLEEENQYTEASLSDTKELQEQLYEEIVALIDPTDVSAPYFKNGYWYYERFADGQEYPIYARKKETLDAPEEVLLNANQRAEGYDYYDMGGFEVSPDNRLMAFAEDTLSRRQYTLRFKNLETGELLPDAISNTQGDGAWTSDNQSYFYTSKDTVTLLSNRVWRHRLGEDASNDVLKYEETDPSFYMGVGKSKSNKYVIIYQQSTLANDYHLLRADQPEGEFERFTAREKKLRYQIEHVGDQFYVLTDWEAPNYRLMTTPEATTDKAQWKGMIAHREDVFLDDLEVFDRYLVLTEKANALPKLRVIDRETNDEHYIQLERTGLHAGVGYQPRARH